MDERNQDKEDTGFESLDHSCKPDGITLFICEECSGDGYEYTTGQDRDGYYEIYKKQCEKCKGTGVVDWVGNVCFE